MVVLSKPLAAGGITAIAVFTAIKLLSKKSKLKRVQSNANNSAKVDWKFIQRMVYLLKNILPGAICKETILMAALMVSLLGRTWMSLWIAWNMGKSNDF